MTATMRLTVDIAPDAEHPTAWVATCLELGVSSAGLTPQLAFSALASVIRLTVNSITAERQMRDSGAGIEVMREIAHGYALTRQAQDGDA